MILFVDLVLFVGVQHVLVSTSEHWDEITCSDNFVLCARKQKKTYILCSI